MPYTIETHRAQPTTESGLAALHNAVEARAGNRGPEAWVVPQVREAGSKNLGGGDAKRARPSTCEDRLMLARWTSARTTSCVPAAQHSQR